jgi:hypothetical protein
MTFIDLANFLHAVLLGYEKLILQGLPENRKKSFK